MPTHMTGKAATVATQNDHQSAPPIRLSHRISATSEIIVAIAGELDIATADQAVNYVQQIIDQHHGPVTVDLGALKFCDVRGLTALLRMAGDAQRAGCPLQLSSPSPSLGELLRITGLDRRFPTTRHAPT